MTERVVSGGIALTMAGIVLQGKLTAGSESCRITEPITLTFTGALYRCAAQ